ncbi:NAD(P)/FAD-dependent oxidoreductase [Streptomyces guryensis]|uniref:FAD-dependent oxidoreductase n=1 Tax=Streptomyces guryensis TaxID=2886947 RepID=A0A9Q3VVZ0_9ACTN|nr:FAD-dependent oxidoreductase [Streptomyces guryensis]MCD9880968.1 FAD-dependent oxidoreductase [Streptomyces guryensis]
MKRIVVVGGSIAAVTAASWLRVRGFDGTVTLLSAETEAPYTRVPLSKTVLSGLAKDASTALPPLDDSVVLRLGTRAASLDTRARHVILESGEPVPYDGLVIATGGRARRLSPPGMSGERVLRTLADCAALREDLTHARNVLVVGAGLLGMEIASTCRTLGLEVTVIDRDPPLRRVLGPVLAEVITTAAREHGVMLRTAPGGVRLVGSHRPEGVEADGELLTADVIVSAVGDVPAVDWLTGSGLTLDCGVVTDSCGRVADHIVAAGDVAVVRGTRRRPHWTNAVEQARVAAAALLGEEVAGSGFPSYFWTSQFGVDVKIAGEPAGLGEPDLVDVDGGSMLLRWSAGAAATVNHTMPVRKIRQLASAS